MEKLIGTLLIAASLIFALARGINHLIGLPAEANREVGGHWILADRASTIKQKSEHIDLFIEALKKMELENLNASYFWPQPNLDFNLNLLALESLQKRLHAIIKMDENDFAYQMAMQQITAQEQGEAKEMIDVFYSCWLQKNHYTYWNPLIVMGFLALQIALLIIGFVIRDI